MQSKKRKLNDIYVLVDAYIASFYSELSRKDKRLEGLVQGPCGSMERYMERLEHIAAIEGIGPDKLSHITNHSRIYNSCRDRRELRRTVYSLDDYYGTYAIVIPDRGKFNEMFAFFYRRVIWEDITEGRVVHARNKPEDVQMKFMDALLRLVWYIGYGDRFNPIVWLYTLDELHATEQFLITLENKEKVMSSYEYDNIVETHLRANSSSSPCGETQ